MADITWIGGASPVAQVDHVTPANVEIGDVFKITLADDAGNSNQISYTAVAATVQDVVDGLQALAVAAKSAGTAPWDDVTVTEDDTKVIITADTAGVPFYVTTAVTDGGGNNTQTLTRSASVANAGPYDWNTAANWSSGVVPGGSASQDIYIDGATIYYGLDQSGAAETLDSLNVTRSQVGTNGATGKAANYLKVKALVVNINYFYGTGTPSHLAPVNIDTGATVDAVINVYNAGTNSPATLPGVRILANDDGAIANIYKGYYAIAGDAGESGEFKEVHVSFVSQLSSDASGVIGSGLTLGTLEVSGGANACNCALTTLTQSAGAVTTNGSGAITTANISGGTATLNSAGTITNLNGTGGTIDMTKSAVARIVTNCKIDPGCTFKRNIASVTLTNGVVPVRTSGNITLTAS